METPLTLTEERRQRISDTINDPGSDLIVAIGPCAPEFKTIETHINEAGVALGRTSVILPKSRSYTELAFMNSYDHNRTNRYN